MYASLLLTISGCSTGGLTVGANAISQSIPAPKIETINKKASVQIKEQVTGHGCRNSVFGIFTSGDSHLLSQNTASLKSDLDYAKAAAEFDALFGKMQNHPPVYHEMNRPFPNDMLIAPLYHYIEKSTVFGKEVCVTVTGFRGVIKTIEDSDSTTAWPDPNYKIIKKIIEVPEKKDTEIERTIFEDKKNVTKQTRKNKLLPSQQ
jgi:hypothetical protein